MIEVVPMMIEHMGVKNAVAWWMKYGHDFPSPEAVRMSVEAIEHMATGDLDHILVTDDGVEMARAFQWVRLFDLNPYVEALRAAQTA
jgi:hypothetical protein